MSTLKSGGGRGIDKQTEKNILNITRFFVECVPAVYYWVDRTQVPKRGKGGLSCVPQWEAVAHSQAVYRNVGRDLVPT